MAAEGLTILVIDDDDTVRTVTRRILEHAGFTAVLAADGATGVELYRAKGPVALVILDMTMPGMDGEQTFEALQTVDPEVRVLVTSGYAEQDATDRFAGMGLSGFIQKPYRPQELLAKIDQVLSAR